MDMVFSEEDTIGASFSGEAFLQEAVRSIAMQQRADGAFPAEKGAVLAEISILENTALATMALLLAADNLSIYRRQIEKSVNYLVNLQLEKPFNKFQFCLAGLAYKLYLEKTNPGKKIARQLSIEIERIQEKVGTLDVLLKPGIPEIEVIKEILNLLGDEKANLKDLTVKSSVKILSTAIFREMSQSS